MNETVSITFASFGYKYGLPIDADLVLDCRELPNPYWVEELRKYTGLDEPIIAWLNEQEDVKKAVEEYRLFLDAYLSRWNKLRRRDIHIYFGCTGGQHRSVYLAEAFYHLYKDTYPCAIHHREIHRYKEGG